MSRHPALPLSLPPLCPQGPQAVCAEVPPNCPTVTVTQAAQPEPFQGLWVQATNVVPTF